MSNRFPELTSSLKVGPPQPVTKDDAIHRLTVALSAYMGQVTATGSRIDRRNAEHLHGLAKFAIHEASRAK